jgi:cyclic pyranopterin phosphate synthase
MTAAALSYSPNLKAHALLDARGRALSDLRISVTDRCNFRCGYCMPKQHFGPGFQFLPSQQLLSNAEIRKSAAAFVALGVKKIRLTGGEPSLRPDLIELVGELASLGPVDLALTTNGSKLAALAVDLKQAGLQRVTVSLDALDEGLFRRLNDVGIGVDTVTHGIDRAAAAGLAVKVNAVIRRGVNEGQILPLARYCRERRLTLRFIEFMDVGATNGWRRSDVVSRAEILSTLREELSLEPRRPRYAGEVAERFVYSDGQGEVGIIASVTQPFCGSCTRARLSADGIFYTCLFATQGVDLRQRLRTDVSGDELQAAIAEIWSQRSDRYSELRVARPIQLRKKIEMSYIGG